MRRSSSEHEAAAYSVCDRAAHQGWLSRRLDAYKHRLVHLLQPLHLHLLDNDSGAARHLSPPDGEAPRRGAEALATRRRGAVDVSAAVAITRPASPPGRRVHGGFTPGAHGSGTWTPAERDFDKQRTSVGDKQRKSASHELDAQPRPQSQPHPPALPKRFTLSRDAGGSASRRYLQP